jgi:hypothetical protein
VSAERRKLTVENSDYTHPVRVDIKKKSFFPPL